MNSYPTSNTFLWELGSFQHYVKTISNQNRIYSPKFWLPSSINSDDNKICDNCAILTPYEKIHNITSRQQKFLLELGKLGPTTIINNNNLIHVPTRKQVVKQQIFEFTFDFSKDNVTCGFPKFCSLELLFPDNDKSKEIDLFIQVTVLGNDLSRSNLLLLLDDDSINQKQLQQQQQEDEEIGNHFEGFSGDVVDYFKNELFVDVEFLFDCGSTLKAHRIILATRCNYFKTMFQSGFKESNLDKIPIHYVKYDVFNVILHYIYTGKLMDLNDENSYLILRDSYKHSDLMGLSSLKRLIAKNVIKLINNDNWNEILIMGWQYDDLLLRTKGLKYVKEHWDSIKRSDNLRDILNNSNVDCIEELFLVANGTDHLVR
ncbi:BTB/POZ protein [Rhizophagus clarus]|uniref:BTB/POZ protein n=1 Tax=Rhizophagus clarus TaxID=94130 RepID=A0A8H3MAY1_9GLOM|nr:BTB/POZ protein [Rhizophagus clarus]